MNTSSIQGETKAAIALATKEGRALRQPLQLF